MTSPRSLDRRLGLADAVFIGLGSMIGAGVFAAFTPAAQAAGSGLLVGLAVAAAVALGNALASAQLAAVYPESAGTYVYARRVLSPWWGFLAGWSFVIGKTASCAAMALTFAASAAPAGWEKPVAVAAVAGLAAVNYRGVTRTAALTRLIVVVVLLALAIVVATAGNAMIDGTVPASVGSGVLVSGGWYGIFQSAGLLFFAFAGYARIATMGEEVRRPERTIPLAIVIALSITVAVYGVIAVAILGVLGADGVAATATPLTDTVLAGGGEILAPLVQVGAAAASLGALLALIAGIGRTSLAMAREGDLPRFLSAVHPRFHVPHRAEVALAVVVSILVFTVDLRGAIAFSSFGVLLYYFVANVAAFHQPAAERRYPRALQVFAGAACVVLVVTLPPAGIAAGIGVLLAGVGYRLLVRRGTAPASGG